MVACYLPHIAPALVLLALLALAAGRFGFGRCPRCGEHREPHCQCVGGNPDDPQVKRPRWKL